VLGHSPDEIIGRGLLGYVDENDVPRLIQLVAGLRHEDDEEIQFQMTHADGRTLTMEGVLTNMLSHPQVSGFVLTVRDVTERHVIEQQLIHQAFHDGLTGLANRELFADRLGQALAPRRDDADPVVVLFCDLDDFKEVNDRLGHAAGDEVLTTVGQRLDAIVRSVDTAARLGGDEFAVLMIDATQEDGELMADRIRARLAAPIEVAGATLQLRVSVGVALAEAGGIDAEEALRNADFAMQWAKGLGKARAEVYNANLHAKALDRLELRSDLQRGLRGEELVLHYQPTMCLQEGTVAGFEALVRWQHPTRGLLAPQAFISIAEQSGLIVELGHWVLREACFAAVGLQTPLHQPTMSVNVAAQQIVQADFVDWVVAALDDSGLAPRHLVLEITESVLLDDMAGAVERLAALRDLGVHVAIDDFGTGYSSLAYLSRLPVDILKVDKTFVDNVCDGREGASVTEAIIAMSRTMQLTTVAEGVELPEQAAWLKEAACTMGQGYLWSRPVDLARAHHLMRAGVPRQRVRTEAQPRHAAPWADDSLG
jgi:diguanylate cyclase (GGDEF)-like protein